ncbi:hypothetical protein D3C83_28860 [compost metagenome]
MIVAGIVSAATVWIRLTASPRAMPGARLNEIVTDGSWPKWFTWNGPTSVRSRATDSSGMRRPALARTCSSDIASGSLWNSGATRRITWY